MSQPKRLHRAVGTVLWALSSLLLLVVAFMVRSWLLGWQSNPSTAFHGFADTNLGGTWPEPHFVRIGRPKDYSGEGLAKALRQKLSSGEMSLVVNPAKDTPAIVAWARELTAGTTNDLQKARRLYDALSARHTDKEVVPSHHLRTASEVFAIWNAPGSSFICQEFTYLYIALARASGLQAYEAFVEQDCYGDWNYHSCTGVFIGGKALLADPVYSWFGAPHKRFALLDDIQTEAVYLCEWHGLKECRIGIKLAPRLSITQACLFDCMVRAARWPEAKQQAALMVRLFPWSPATLHARAAMAFHEGKLAQALEFLEKAVMMAPHDPDNYNLLGAIYAQKGDRSKARAAWQNASRYALNAEAAKSFQRSAISMDAWEFCDRGYARANAGDWGGALSNYNYAIELTPEWAEAYAYRANAEQSIGNLAAALADDTKAIQLQTDYIWAYQLLGKIYAKLGQTNEAKGAYRNALLYSTNSNSQAAEAHRSFVGEETEQ